MPGPTFTLSRWQSPFAEEPFLAWQRRADAGRTRAGLSDAEAAALAAEEMVLGRRATRLRGD